MRVDFVEKLHCPAPDCDSATLVLRARRSDMLEYSVGPVEEVREGDLHCERCMRLYPINDYVPAFDQLFPEQLQKEADYWAKWYGFMWERGYTQFFDLRSPVAPLIFEGIPICDPSSLAGHDLPGVHTALADHPLLQSAQSVLDVGCGTGWSSLYLARRGHSVVAFDPSHSNMVLAKRYAIRQGIYIEYLSAAVGFLDFENGCFDAIFGLHSLHHVPHLRTEMLRLRDWLHEGGLLAVDEHIRTSPLLNALAQQMYSWAQEEVFPNVRTVLREELRKSLPQAEHSALEDAGSAHVLQAILDNFEVESFSSRFVSLDQFSFIYFLSRHEDRDAYEYSADVLHRLYQLLLKAFPEGAEYVTLVARKGAQGAGEAGAAAWQASSMAVETLYSPNPEVAVLKAELAALRHDLLLARQSVSEAIQSLMQSQAQLAASNAYVSSLVEAVNAKNRHIAELEQWARTLERDILNRPSVMPPGNAFARILRRVRALLSNFNISRRS